MLKPREVVLRGIIPGFLLFSFSLAFTAPAGSDTQIKTAQSVPKNAHYIRIEVREGKAIQIQDSFFDGSGVQMREDFYSFEAEPLALGDLVQKDMAYWNSMKTRWLPEHISMSSTEYNREMFVDEIEQEILEGNNPEEECDETASIKESVRALIIYENPNEDPRESFEWEHDFASETLAGQGLYPHSYTDEETGEYRFIQGLFEEWYEACTGARPTEPDCSLVMTWYDPRYNLPTKRLIFGVRPDSSKYLHSVFLAEYDSPDAKNWFDPEGTPFHRLGLQVIRYDLSKGSILSMEGE